MVENRDVRMCHIKSFADSWKKRKTADNTAGNIYSL